MAKTPKKTRRTVRSKPAREPLPESFLTYLAELTYKNNRIDQEHYDRWEVMRGLRRPDGAGVLAGLTQIGDVHGFIVDEQTKIPVDGRLKYRGFDIRDLVAGYQKEKRHGFEEVCYLLLFGALPNAEQLDNFKQMLDENRALPPGFIENMILEMPSGDIMNALARSVLMLYSFDKDAEDRSLRNILRQCIKLIAIFPTIAAYSYQARNHYYEGKSLFIHKPLTGLSTAENLLLMIRPDRKFTKTEADLLDLNLVLHAEHGGGNNSSFTAHVVSSADTDIYSSIAAALGSLKGYKHGGANIKVRRMMKNIMENVKDWKDENEVADYLTKIMQKKAFDKAGLIYGIGHAVYTLSDPRAVLLKKKAELLAKETGRTDEFNLLALVEKIGPEIFRKIKESEKVVSANVDFYSGFVYSMMDIPTSLYTPLFAVSRIAGWSAHILEERISGGRIYRPAYKSVCEQQEFVPLEDRR